MQPFKMLIDGKLVDGAYTLNVINPADEEILAVAPRADEAQLNQAIAAAKRAFQSWSKTPFVERSQALMRVADALQARAEELGSLLTKEQGKPLHEAMGEIHGSAAMIRFFGSQELPPKILRETETDRIVQRFAPLGVVAAIAPWNAPLGLLMLKVPAALATGNTVIAKPAATTPLTTLRFGEICAEYLPAGVFNVIVDNNDLGAALTRHPDIAKVSFTGSTQTGKKVYEAVASTIKRLTLEMGGNDAAIVLNDVDPKEVAPKLFAGAMVNTGQVCLAIKRLYVHESQYDEMVEELAKCAREAIVDDGMKQGTQYGPLQNKQQFEKVMAYIDVARRDGVIVTGGERLYDKGYFIQPTIVRDIDDDSPLVREEQFGPVLPVLKYEDLDEAIARANDSDQGLGGSVWGKDLDKAYEVAAQIESGIVWVNKHLEMQFDVPAGGAKQSGLGVEWGREGVAEYVQAHVVNMKKI